MFKTKKIVIISLSFILFSSIIVGCQSSSSDKVTKADIDEIREKLKELDNTVLKALEKEVEKTSALWASPDHGPIGCAEYHQAITFLHNGGNRLQAAELFDKLTEMSKQYSDANIYFSLHQLYVPMSQEYSKNLRKMSEEDKNWKAPENILKLSKDEQIAVYVYRLRDIADYQITKTDFFKDRSRQYYCDNTDEIKKLPAERKNAITCLAEFGYKAIPTLLTLLDDRRPTRSIMFWNNHLSSGYHLVCYGDIAQDVLYIVLPKELREKWFLCYGTFSSEFYKNREKAIDEIKAYWEQTEGDKPEK